MLDRVPFTLPPLPRGRPSPPAIALHSTRKRERGGPDGPPRPGMLDRVVDG